MSSACASRWRPGEKGTAREWMRRTSGGERFPDRGEIDGRIAGDLRTQLVDAARVTADPVQLPQVVDVAQRALGVLRGEAVGADPDHRRHHMLAR